MAVIMYSPDIKFTALIYTPIFLVARVCQLIIRYDMTQIEIALWYVEETLMMIMIANVTFYIYQTCILDSFFGLNAERTSKEQLEEIIETRECSLLIVDKTYQNIASSHLKDQDPEFAGAS